MRDMHVNEQNKQRSNGCNKNRIIALQNEWQDAAKENGKGDNKSTQSKESTQASNQNNNEGKEKKNPEQHASAHDIYKKGFLSALAVIDNLKQYPLSFAHIIANPFLQIFIAAINAIGLPIFVHGLNDGIGLSLLRLLMLHMQYLRLNFSKRLGLSEKGEKEKEEKKGGNPAFIRKYDFHICLFPQLIPSLKQDKDEDK